VFCIHQWIALTFATSLTQIHRTLFKLLTPSVVYLHLNSVHALARYSLCVSSREMEVPEWEVGKLHPVQIYLVYRTSSKYYFLVGLSRFSYQTDISVCMLCLYPLPAIYPLRRVIQYYTVLRFWSFTCI
jgi:hypothetical protein